MCKFESLQKDVGRAQSAEPDSLKAYTKARAFICCRIHWSYSL